MEDGICACSRQIPISKRKMCRSRAEYHCRCCSSVSGRSSRRMENTKIYNKNKNEMKSVIFSAIIMGMPNKRTTNRVSFAGCLSQFDGSVKNFYASFLFVLCLGGPIGIFWIPSTTWTTASNVLKREIKRGGGGGGSSLILLSSQKINDANDFD